jgi:VWFA-related protein
VTDKAGKPVAHLEPQDFSLFDNGQPTKIISFHTSDGTSTNPDPPVEVILLIDKLNTPASLGSLERDEVERFLRQNGGHLAQPVSILELSDTGLWTVAKPAADGNALAAEIAHNREIAVIRSRQSGEHKWDFGVSPAQSALRALAYIAAAARREPGRKLLIWVGPGWGIGSGEYSGELQSKEVLLATIHWVSTLLREARLAVYSFSVGETDPSSSFYMDYIDGPKSPRQASFIDLNRKVLAVQSGGLVLGPSNDLVTQIDSCVQGAGAFYTMSFDPSHADHPDEYHGLKVQVDKPGLTARSNTGYYDQPYYSNNPNPAARHVTVEQLEQALGAARGEPDAEVARKLSGLELTERLSDTKLSSWTAALRGKKARQTLIALADASAFLAPPPAEIPADAAPDLTAQRHMISLAADYLNKTIPTLPDFFAERTTARYEETPEYEKASTRMDYQPLHVADTSKATVLYRNGHEVVESGASKPRKQKPDERYLITYGTFGPLLGAAIDALDLPGGLTWSRWEQGAGGARAVFHYAIPVEKSRYQVGGCCLPDGDGTTGFRRLAGFYGEMAIDPVTGTLLRLELQADLKSTTPLARSDIMIEYGPVQIAAKTYICPVRSVSIMRARSVATLTNFDESFRTYGPYATTLNNISFDDYHIFRVKARMLTGFNPAPEEKSPNSGPAHLPDVVPPTPP